MNDDTAFWASFHRAQAAYDAMEPVEEYDPELHDPEEEDPDMDPRLHWESWRHEAR